MHGAAVQARQHVIARADDVERAVAQDGQPVGVAHQRGPVRHQHHRRSHALQPRQCDAKRFLSVGVEIRVRLVEHDQLRSAVHGSRQRDALPLAARQHGTGVAQLGVVGLRQARDHLVHAGQSRRCDDRLRVDRPELRDVVCHRAGKQLHVLRQVADHAGQLLGRPVGQLHAVQAHRACVRLAQAEHQPQQRRLARGAGTDQAQAFARRQRQAHALDERRALRIGQQADPLQAQLTAQRWQLQCWCVMAIDALDLQAPPRGAHLDH